MNVKIEELKMLGSGRIGQYYELGELETKMRRNVSKELDANAFFLSMGTFMSGKTGSPLK